MEISIHALAGGSEHKTIRLKGVIKEIGIAALIDSGKTHCFLDEQVAKSLGLGSREHTLVVKVANGEKVQSNSLAKPVT